jgi:hypothetical protein
VLHSFFLQSCRSIQELDCEKGTIPNFDITDQALGEPILILPGQHLDCGRVMYYCIEGIVYEYGYASRCSNDLCKCNEYRRVAKCERGCRKDCHSPVYSSEQVAAACRDRKVEYYIN